MEYDRENTESPDHAIAAATEPLTVLELRVFLYLWIAMPHYQIAEAIGKSRRQVTRIAQRIARKIQRLDPSLILFKLETELFMRIPQMKTSELLKALSIYVRARTLSSQHRPLHTTGTTEVKMGLKNLLQELFTDYKSSQKPSES